MTDGEKIVRLLEMHGFDVPGSDRAMICPFCGQRKFFLNIGKGLFHCMRTSCEASEGGNYFTIVRRFYDGDDRYKQAYQDLKRSGCDLAFERKFAEMPKQEKEEAPLEQRAKTYGLLRKCQMLTPAIKTELHRRGLTDSQIKKWGFTALPMVYSDRIRIADKLISEGADLEGCPGFVKNGQKYAVADFGHENRIRAFGNVTDQWYNYYVYLIPSFDLYGNTQFFQIAWDKRLTGENGKYKYAKYTSFSNPKAKSGGKAKARCGYVGPYKEKNGKLVPDLKGQTKLPIIEGTLKSILYHEFTGGKEAVISQVGVSNMRAVEEFLAQLHETCPEVDTIIDCYDMDKITVEDVINGSEALKRHVKEFGKEAFIGLMNQDVQKASAKLKETVEKMGYKYEKRLWDPKYKGIDDLLYGKLSIGERKSTG